MLMYKEHLPVSAVEVGDTGRAGSEAKLTVGPLRCRGDQLFWNAASFVGPASHLLFTSFRAERSTDLSFYFKTSSSHGVFLENSGPDDLLLITLRGSSVVSLLFGLGTSQMELLVRSPSPLNDDRWHRVEVEKNLKEASVRLDGAQREARNIPQGNSRAEVYTQLVIGAAGGQRAFLGCMRALRINGVNFDLEERAKVTAGVTPGCRGHCSSFGIHCQNGGRCVEQYNDYRCDCGGTAFDGQYCTEDVGGYFETGTLVRYDFLPETSELTSVGSVGLVSEQNLTQEELSFSFSTTSAPCILVYVSSRTQDYLAVVLRHNGTLQIRYSLGGLKEPFIIDMHHRNMANGQPHSVSVSRRLKDIRLQVDHYPEASYSLPAASDTHFNLIKSIFLGKVFETGQIDPVLIERYNTPGFVGCLSRVQFNSLAPLKAALRSGQSSRISTHGILVPSNCGAAPHTLSPLSQDDPWHVDPAGVHLPSNTDKAVSAGGERNSAVIGGVVSVVIFIVLCFLIFLVRHIFRHKGSYHTNEAKGQEAADCADAAIIVSDPAFTETIEESKKEWFI